VRKKASGAFRILLRNAPSRILSLKYPFSKLLLRALLRLRRLRTGAAAAALGARLGTRAALRTLLARATWIGAAARTRPGAAATIAPHRTARTARPGARCALVPILIATHPHRGGR